MKQTNSKAKNNSDRDDVLKYALKNHGISPIIRGWLCPDIQSFNPRNMPDSLLHESEEAQHE